MKSGMLNSGELYEVMNQFEKVRVRGRLDKEAFEYWKAGHYYQNGEVNELFRFFLHGYSCGKCVGRMEA